MATEVGQPDLVYKFMDLAHHQQVCVCAVAASSWTWRTTSRCVYVLLQRVHGPRAPPAGVCMCCCSEFMDLAHHQQVCVCAVHGCVYVLFMDVCMCCSWTSRTTSRCVYVLLHPLASPCRCVCAVASPCIPLQVCVCAVASPCIPLQVCMCRCIPLHPLAGVCMCCCIPLNPLAGVCMCCCIPLHKRLLQSNVQQQAWC